MTDVMSRILREAKEEHLRQHFFNIFYRRLHLNNLIRRAEYMEAKGEHLEEKITQQSLTVSIAEIASHMSTTTESRHRMAKEVAEELIADKGEQAYLFCLEKLANDTKAPKLWRDVLTYLDEMKGETK